MLGLVQDGEGGWSFEKAGQLICCLWETSSGSHGRTRLQLAETGWEATARREGAAGSPQVRPWAGMESGGMSDRGQGWDSWTGDPLQVKDEEEEHDLGFLGM